jgi:ATP-dependent exoDNAse (exonuclease V) beta subunit
VRGQIDRLAIGLRGGQVLCAEVLDFKTDAKTAGMDEKELAMHALKYKGQLEAYREAAAQQLGLAEGDVSMSLVFLPAGRVVPLHNS